MNEWIHNGTGAAGRKEGPNSKGACSEGYTEMQWIDLLLGKLGNGQSLSMHKHLANCSHCRNVYREWGPLLSAGSAPGDDHPAAVPSAELKKRLIHDVRSIRMRRLSTGRTLWTAAAGAAILIMLLFGMGRLIMLPGTLDRYIMENEPSAVAVMKNPTTAYRVTPGIDGIGQAYVWINDGSHEMLVLVDGSRPSGGQVYQAWAVKGEKYDNIGLLKQGQGRAHLYVKTEIILEAEKFMLSMEPLGGSPSPSPRHAVLNTR
ncbi:anti-sigma factor [Paenibacillus tarimensis]